MASAPRSNRIFRDSQVVVSWTYGRRSRTRRNESLIFVRPLDPNFYGLLLHLDCPIYRSHCFRVIFRRAGSLILETADSITLQWQGSQSKLMHQNLLSKWNQGADAPLLEVQVVAAMDKNRRHRSVHHLHRAAPSMNFWVPKVKVMWGQPP